MTKWFENCKLVGKLWFHNKMSWETKRKINDYLWLNQENKKIMEEINIKLTYMVQNIDKVHVVNF